jgi:hypothetical protein
LRHASRARMHVLLPELLVISFAFQRDQAPFLLFVNVSVRLLQKEQSFFEFLPLIFEVV